MFADQKLEVYLADHWAVRRRNPYLDNKKENRMNNWTREEIL